MGLLLFITDGAQILSPDYKEELVEIARRTTETAQNTSHSFLSDGWNILALASMVIALVALGIDLAMWFGIKSTRSQIKEEAERDRVGKECQQRLLLDIVRHLYRNKLCTLAMYAKYTYEREQGYNCYPSEEHVLKLKLLPSDIHFDEYYREPKSFRKLHEVQLQFRNYNTEIDVAYTHISNPAIDAETVKRDFQTLDFKTGFLTCQLFELMDILYTDPGRDNLSEIKKAINESHSGNIEKNSDTTKYGWKYAEYLYKLYEPANDIMSGDYYFTHIFESEDERELFANNLETDLLIETGLNTKGEEKIHIIRR